MSDSITDPVIELRDIRKRFRKTAVLEGVNLRVPAGKTYAFSWAVMARGNDDNPNADGPSQTGCGEGSRAGDGPGEGRDGIRAKWDIWRRISRCGGG